MKSNFYNSLTMPIPLIGRFPCHSTKKNADAFKGMIVSDSEIEDPEEYVEENKERLKILVERRRRTIKRRSCYLKAKKLAERKFLSRKQSKRTNTIIHQYPDIEGS